jgi:hypothetical protein
VLISIEGTTNGQSSQHVFEQMTILLALGAIEENAPQIKENRDGAHGTCGKASVDEGRCLR